MKLPRALPILLMLASSMAPAAPTADAARPLTRAERALSEAEQKRFDAMVANDLAALGGILADELSYTHSTGVQQTKAEFLKDLESGKTRYQRITLVEQHLRLHGSIGIIDGVLRL